MTEANKSLMKRFVSEYQSGDHDEDVLSEVISDAVIDHSAPAGLPPGRQGVKALHDAFFAAFADFHAVIQDQIAEGTGILLPDPADLPAFGCAVSRLLDDPELAARTGRAAQEHVRANFVGDLHLLKYAKLFSTLLVTRE